MAGLLDNIFATSQDDPRYAANMALFGNMVKGDFGGGLLAASQAGAQARTAQQEAQYRAMQIQNMQAEAQARQQEAAQKQAEMERQLRIQQALPSLYGMQGAGAPQGPQPMPQRAPMGGGQAMPMPEGEPMESPAPMPSSQPGRFNAHQAALMGMHPDMIQKYAAIDSIGRQEVARTINVPGPNGEKMVLQIDKFGQPVGKPMTEFEAAQLVNLGDRQAAVIPRPGMQLPMGMSPEAKASNALGWANHGLTKRGQDMADARARETASAGKWQYDATRGGLVNMQTGEFKAATQNGQPIETKASKEAEKEAIRQKSAVAQADSVLQEVRDAKKMVGLNTAGVGGMLASVPATEARDLSNKLQTVKANLGFDRLQQMRQESPTGGALGAVALQELVALQSTVASLDQMQSPGQLGQALEKIEKHYTNWRNVVSQAQGGQGGATSSFEAPPQNLPKPMKGMVRNGYRFKGGDPANQANWEKM